MYDRLRRALVLPTLAALTTLAGAARAAAQAPAPATPPSPPPPWTGGAGFGLSLSRGNTATTNLNVSFEATHDPKTRSVWKAKGLYFRGQNNGTLAVDRLSLDARNERSVGKRAYAFANLQFLKDQFKAIDYLVAPGAGIGYKVVATPATTLNVDGGLGVKLEKNTTQRRVSSDLVLGVSDRRTDAIVTASDRFEHKLSTAASVTQSFGVLWKAQDFGDALYTFTAGAAAALTSRTQLKLELFNSYASRPPTAAVKRNDVALLTTLVYKF